jgi:hypothetical protein
MKWSGLLSVCTFEKEPSMFVVTSTQMFWRLTILKLVNAIFSTSLAFPLGSGWKGGVFEL